MTPFIKACLTAFFCHRDILDIFCRPLLLLHICLERESQPPFDGLYKDEGLFEDMHGLQQDQSDASHVR